MKSVKHLLCSLFTIAIVSTCLQGAFGQGNSGSAPEFVLYKYYPAFPTGILPITTVGDSLGTIYFKAKPITGSPFRTGASIQAYFEGPTSADALPASLVFRTGPLQQYNRMAITSSGLVGIGTLTPQFHLDVVGNTHTSGDFFGRIHFDKNQTTNDAPNTYIDEAYFELKNTAILTGGSTLPASAGTQGGILTLAPGGTSLDHQLYFGDDGIWTRRQTGNAPDWTSAIWYKLLSGEQIMGTPNRVARFLPPGPVSNSLGDSQLWDDGTQVGIGTSTPTAGFFLDINGRTRINGNETVTGNAHVNGVVTIGTNNTPASLGVVNTANYRLFVSGGILTEEVLVRTGWADHVFNKSYPLRPLEEVEQHINKEGHLPDMPSAQEVETNGLKLAESAVNQQVKIEELFLYLIEMNKEIKALKVENEQLKAKVLQLEKH